MLTLNEEQTQVRDNIIQFLLSPERELRISGPGGVGKTYLIIDLARNLLSRYSKVCGLMGITNPYKTVQVTATTNKAVEAIVSLGNIDAQTIHSFLNLTVKEDYQTGETVISRKVDWFVKRNLILIIDEYSMVDQALYDEIYKSTMDCKIIYVGDHCQLAPIGLNYIPVDGSRSPVELLSTPMRNGGYPSLVQTCNDLRKAVQAPVGTLASRPIIHTDPGVIDWVDGPRFQQEIDAHFLDPNHNHKILAYRNSTVIEYNNYIRSLRKLPSQITVGETLINNYIVEFIIGSSYFNGNNSYSLHRNNKLLPVEAECQITRIGIPAPLLVNNVEAPKVVPMDLISHGRPYLNVAHCLEPEKLKALLKYLSSNKNWKTFFMVKNGIIDLRQRDASTVHKAQGSTYDTVFLDIADLTSCNAKSMVARMLYVAVSRARHRLVIYGDPRQDYNQILGPKLGIKP